MNKYILIGISTVSINGAIYSIIGNNNNIDAVFINNRLIDKPNQDIIEGETPEEEIIKVDFSELLTKIESNVTLYEKTKNISYLDIAIDSFGSIPKYSNNLTNDIVKNSNELYEFFKDIRYYCYNLDSKTYQEDYVKKFSEKIFLGWKYDKNISYFKDKFLIEGLVQYNKGILSNIQERLNYLEYVAKYYLENGDPYPEHEIIPEISLPENPLPDDNNDNNNDNNDNNDNNNDNNNNNSNNSNNNSNNNINNNKPNTDISIEGDKNNYTHITKFKKEGNKCYEIKETYLNGKKTKEYKTLASKSDYVQCSIYDYVNFGSGTSLPNIEIDEDYLHNDQNVDSEYFAYYTVTKGDKIPYYYNPGIRASSNGDSLSYNQLSDLLYQLVVKTEDFSVKSNKKSLFVIKGKPIVLDSNKNPDYTKIYIENMLNEHPDLGLKIMKNSQFKSSLAEYEDENLNRDYISNITINDLEVEDKNIAWINENGILKTDIKTITELLGASTEIKEDKLVIKKDSIEIILQNNKIEYFVNNENSSFLEKTYKNKSKFISELADIPQRLGYDVDFDIEKNKLEFTKTDK